MSIIFARDKGRMCNNLLQFAHLYAWGREHGVRVVSMRFAYKFQWFAVCHTRYHWAWLYVVVKLLAFLRFIPTVRFHEPTTETEASQRLASAGPVCVAEGWHVRFYDLFLKYRSEITALFAFDPAIEAAVTSRIAATTDEGDVLLGVHIRRGDYRTWQGGRYFYDDDVYVRYIRLFLAMHSLRHVTVYLCGNDPALSRDFYATRLPGIRVVLPNGTPAEDLCLLSHCDFLIGAPSTFSLVAAMYRDTPLCWMETATPGALEFNKFDYLFRHIH